MSERNEYLNSKCKLCKKKGWDHNAMTKACPIKSYGRRGFCGFHSRDRFSPQELPKKDLTP
jgi:hypothetical protein